MCDYSEVDKRFEYMAKTHLNRFIMNNSYKIEFIFERDYYRRLGDFVNDLEDYIDLNIDELLNMKSPVDHSYAGRISIKLTRSAPWNFEITTMYMSYCEVRWQTKDTYHSPMMNYDSIVSVLKKMFKSGVMLNIHEY
jgi:hypothetical protein